MSTFRKGLVIGNFEPKGGEKRKAVEIVASDKQMLGNERDGEVARSDHSDTFDDGGVPF